MKFRGLAARKHFSNSELSREELFEIADVLTEILNDAPHLSTRLVAYINSTIGLVRLLLGEHDSAINSFVKALWIMAVTKAECTEEIGLTVQRLGIAHGRIGYFNEAVSLLEKSIAIYRSGGMQESHPCMLSALNELEVIRPKLVQAEVNLLKLHPQSSERARRLLRKTGAYSNATANELALET
ncbi:hypothetical protein MHU86_23675 [Fragilaria crotonensis]|nr:hypothetical protein MHU86_23675 [Fragilaria crotonensis]